MRRIKHTIFGSVLVSISLLVSFPAAAIADVNVDINGNGSNSSNAVSVTQSQSTNVSSTNTADVTNNVSSDANTGNNSANANTGGNTTITTGNVQSDVAVTNDMNHTTIEGTQCCPNDTNVNVSGNGAGSVNVTDIDNITQSTITVMNNATIKNNITVHANTGNNTANNNTGSDNNYGNDSSVTIKTGNIHINGDVTNEGINNATIDASVGASGDQTVTVINNGVETNNIVTISQDHDVTIDKTDFADILNNVTIDANTGNNHADNNTAGDVEIVTGNIDINFTVANEDINTSVITVTCCEPSPSPSVAPPPSTSPSPVPTELSNPGQGGGPSNSSSGGGGGSVGGVSVATPEVLNQAILPVTGAAIPFKAIFMAAISVLGMGVLLRMMAGRYATAWQVDTRRPSKRVLRRFVTL